MVKKGERCLGEALAQAVIAAAKGNSHTSVPVAAVLWPAKMEHGLPGSSSCSSVFLTCSSWALTTPSTARGRQSGSRRPLQTLPEVAPKGVPVIYLPGDGRARRERLKAAHATCNHWPSCSIAVSSGPGQREGLDAERVPSLKERRAWLGCRPG